MSAPSIRVLYFDFGGRGTPVRIALHMAGLAFEDKRISWKELTAMKGTAEVPLGSLPVLSVDGKHFTQTNAMVRWAGRKGGLYPDEHMMAIDEVIEINAELMYKAPQHKDEEEKKRLREEFAAGKLTTFFTYIDGKIKANGGWTGGPDLSIADIITHSTCAMIMSGLFDHVPKTFFDKFDNVQAWLKKYMAHPKVEAFYKDYKN